jgi:hypothetical protein
MARRRLALFLVLAAIGVAIGVTIASGAPARRHAPSINVRPVPPTCFVAGLMCSVEPSCVEFVAAARSQRPSTRCATYLSPRRRLVFVQR